MSQITKYFDSSKISIIRGLEDQLKILQSKKDNSDKRSLAQQELLQSELDSHIAADCPMCGYLMIESLAIPLITEDDLNEAASWTV